jgi:hypothetical protein
MQEEDKDEEEVGSKMGCKVWRRIGLAGAGKGKDATVSAFQRRPLMPRLHSPECLGHNAASRRVSL